MKIFIVKDKLSNTPAGVPFFSPATESAVRDCLVQFKGHEHTLNQFDLYHIGEYDAVEGRILSSDFSLVCNLTQGQSLIDCKLGISTKN